MLLIYMDSCISINKKTININRENVNGQIISKVGDEDYKKWEDPKMENLSKACQKKKKKMKSFIEFHTSICRVYFRD